MTQEFEANQDASHPEWSEGDPDGFMSRVSVGWGGWPPSEIDPEQMLEWEPIEAVQHIQAELENEDVGEARNSLLGAVQQAVRTDPAWGAEVLVFTFSDPDLAQISEAVLWAIREEAPGVPDKSRILTCIAESAFADGLEQPIGRMLQSWSAELEKDVEERILDLFDTAADMIYECSNEVEPGIEGKGYAEAARNHPAGHAAQTWWRVAEVRDWVDGQFVLSMDEAEKERWARVISDTTTAGSYARPIVGMATNRFAAGDAPWATDEIFPSFDAERHPVRAAQLWDGRLSQRHWSWGVVELLKPYLDGLFSESAELVPYRSKELGDWVAMLAANPGDSGLTIEDVHHFVDGGTLEARHEFARSIPRHLGQLSQDERTEAWQGLLREYWEDRRTNMPLALETGEVTKMVAWVTALPEIASEVLDQLEASPGQNLEGADRLLWEWKKDGSWVSANPTEASRLVRFLAERDSVSVWFGDEAVDVLENALESGAQEDIVKAAAESLVPIAQAASALLESLSD